MSFLREANSEPIAGYRLIEPLGSGGFGEVWKCEAPGGLYKAIKFVYGSLNSLDVDGARAEQEWKALQRIKEVRHPFVCSVERIDNVNGELIIIMELADRTLHDQFQECQTSGLIGIPRHELLRYMRDAAEALDYLNEKFNLQHLDVKPRNLFLIGDRVKVADFGLVKHLERQGNSGMLGGVTPLYASPETFTGKISPQSDQYSLAIVYQEMLTGHRPFTGKNVRQLAQAQLQGDPDLRALPEAERAIVGKALAKDPAKRFATCVAFVTALVKARPAVAAPVPVGAGAGKRGGGGPGLDDGDDHELDALADRDDVSRLDITSLSVPSAEDLVQPAAEPDQDDMGRTVMQPDTGVLRPTLIIGVGHFGRKALLELRCRFLDRFGDLSKLPLLRFLCIDSDPDAANTAILGAPEVALSRSEFYPLPLQPVGNYRRRSLDLLSEWLPREKLYAMPRSLQTQGSRALGRLAFADNQQRLLARLRREIQEITKPDNVYSSVSQTGLALINSTPRVYVLAAAGGGCSGLLPDLGYALRRLLAHLRHPDARVTTFLLGGALQDPATPKGELANVYATLTELNHYSDASISFSAQYGTEGQRIVDAGSPFHSVYLLPLPHRSPQALDETVAHLGSYLFHELSTPVGLKLDTLRLAEGGGGSAPSADTLSLPVRSFGTYAVWFPRGLLLHLAARQACKRLVESWVAAENVNLPADVQQAVDTTAREFATAAELAPDAVAARIEAVSRAGTPSEPGDTPGEVLTGMLTKLEEQIVQPVAHSDPGNWAKQALHRLRDWIGSAADGEQELGEWRKTRLARVLMSASQSVAEEWEQRISKQVLELTGHPGARVAAAEAALQQLQTYFLQAAERQRTIHQQQVAKTVLAYRAVESAALECGAGGGGLLFFMGKSKGRQLRYFVDQLTAFAHARLKEELLGAARHCYANLAGRLAERLRDLGFCRQRLRHLQQNLEHGPGDPDEDTTSTRPGAEYTVTHSPLPAIDSFWAVIRQSSTARVVLPEGAEDLEQAALRFLQGLNADAWLLLDKELHEHVLTPRGGLYSACIASGDLTRQLSAPLLEEAGKFLSQYLPIVDVSQILSAEAGEQPDAPTAELQHQTREYLDRAVPLLALKGGEKQNAFLLIPASPAGKHLGEAINKLFPDVKLVRVPGQSDLMFLREQGGLTAADLLSLLKASRAAYNSLAGAPNSSPHARFDITDWMPLDP
jgi:hypothetical protein